MDDKKSVFDPGSSEISDQSSPKYISKYVSPVKTPPRYKQCYRVEWESMAVFKDWLKPVLNEPNRAYCTYCDKSLHAHRLSLLKHTITVRHTRAAQRVYTMKVTSGLPIPSSNPVNNMQSETEPNVLSTEDPFICATVDEEESHSDEEHVVSDSLVTVENKDIVSESIPPPPKVARMEASPIITQRSKLSTHVLDTAKGIPVGGLQVSLYKLIDSRWRILSEGFTNPDGRYSDFLEKDSALSPGRYKMHFDVDRYFELRKQESLYPFIEIVFDVKSPHDHYHIPLLLSPYGYTTYRGS